MKHSFSLAAFFILAACAYGEPTGYWSQPVSQSEPSPARYEQDWTPAPSQQSWERTTVRTGPDGPVITTRKPEETTIVRPGGVTIIQRDPDGTRTIIDTDRGVRVEPSTHRRRHR